MKYGRKPKVVQRSIIRISPSLMRCVRIASVETGIGFQTNAYIHNIGDREQCIAIQGRTVVHSAS